MSRGKELNLRQYRNNGWMLRMDPNALPSHERARFAARMNDVAVESEDDSEEEPTEAFVPPVVARSVVEVAGAAGD